MLISSPAMARRGKTGVSEMIARLPILVLLAAVTAQADTFTKVASYETAESDLILTRGATDPTLTISIVTGGTAGAPPATDGARVLKLQYTNEADRKIEYRHDWTT